MNFLKEKKKVNVQTTSYKHNWAKMAQKKLQSRRWQF